MFLEAMNATGIEFEYLEKNICYSFVLQHPKNRIVVPITVPNLYLVKTYICEQGVEEGYYNNITEISPLISKGWGKIPLDLAPMGDNWDDIIEYLSSDNLPYTVQGIVIINKKTGRRTKLRSKNYEKVKHLKGNSPKMQYHYYY